ncbi:hypothetical protein Y032_0066g3722 [Ancylostoma ceylanicum]|uniref:Uncharacterized protein n=1 Tax=Ancylostoma ceylanicum TaxID=53326 RepID=A0A016U008_9BILA|nr:hypothetical protein Y032_0066g3722 [Ancylostoma ceylanicum]
MVLTIKVEHAGDDRIASLEIGLSRRRLLEPRAFGAERMSADVDASESPPERVGGIYTSTAWENDVRGISRHANGTSGDVAVCESTVCHGTQS